MRLSLIAAAAALSLAGCSEYQRSATSFFEPGPNDTFRMFAKMQGVDISESERLSWIATYLSDQARCPEGYEITERKEVILSHGLLGDLKNVYYNGKCKT